MGRQPRGWKINKSIRIETLDWGNAIGGENFSAAIASHFLPTTRKVIDATIINDESSSQTLPHSTECNNESSSQDDPIRLITHVVASDVHYGETTLGPLSSVISALKLRAPSVTIILVMKERHLDAVANLKLQIEQKVQCGLELKKNHCGDELQDFSVSVRDVLYNDMDRMKMLKC